MKFSRPKYVNHRNTIEKNSSFLLLSVNDTKVRASNALSVFSVFFFFNAALNSP